MQVEQVLSILNEEELSDWKLKIINSGGGLCLHEDKQIWIDKDEFGIALILHEIAHALLPEKERNHTFLWADKYTKLVDKYCKPKLYKFLDEKDVEKILKNNSARLDLNFGINTITEDKFKDIAKEICFKLNNRKEKK